MVTKRGVAVLKEILIMINKEHLCAFLDPQVSGKYTYHLMPEIFEMGTPDDYDGKN